MKKIKLSSFTWLLSLIYTLILGLPLFSILARTIYVQSNKNAFQSYSGVTSGQVEQTSILPSTDMFSIGGTYSYINELVSYSGTSNRLEIVPQDYTFKIGNATYTNVDRLVWYKEGASTNYFYYHDTTNHYVNLNNSLANITFVVSQYTFTNDNFDNPMFSYFYTVSYYGNYYLDNAFEYSLQEITSNNNIGRLNLVNWFTNVFLDDTNPTNLLYLNFVNWYFNYALLISSVYLLFLVLMWFVTLARRLIYKGMEF